ncbi:MAG: hypothetical protein ACYCU0_12260 [Solirubrobacteraceae bacterium]
MFALCDQDRLLARILDAGFAKVRLDSLAITRRHASFEEFWDCTLDTSVMNHDAFMELPSELAKRAVAEIRARLGRYEQDDGTLLIPAQTLVASAEA